MVASPSLGRTRCSRRDDGGRDRYARASISGGGATTCPLTITRRGQGSLTGLGTVWHPAVTLGITAWLTRILVAELMALTNTPYPFRGGWIRGARFQNRWL